MSEPLFNIARSNELLTPAVALHVEVIADFVCPFSYLGKRRLDEALKAVAGPTDVSWHPFQLNPGIPAEGQDFDEYLALRFGSRDRIQPVLEELTREGERQGIHFAFDRIRHVPNTLPAHQVMQHARTLGKDQAELAEALMSAFFEHGRDISQRDVLIELAEGAGMRGREVRKALASEELRRVVVAREAQVRSSGLNAAPGFLLNRRLMVVGAQPTEAIVNAFDRAMFGEGADELVSPALH